MDQIKKKFFPQRVTNPGHITGEFMEVCITECIIGIIKLYKNTILIYVINIKLH